MLKKIFIIMVLIFVFLAVSVYIFRANIKQYAITTILKSFPLPNVALANVNFDESAGKLKLEEIKVKNPKGFESPHIMEARSVDMDIRFTTKPELRLTINDIDIADPVFYLERSRDGKWNLLEYTGKKTAAEKAGAPPEKSFSLIRQAFAEETGKRSQIAFPRKVNITNGAVRLMDDFVVYGETHRVNFSPVNGVVSLDYLPQQNSYEKIRFNGSCNINGMTGRVIKGDFELYPMTKGPDYKCSVNAYNIPLSTVKPYLDRYTPFIVTQGSFNVASEVTSADGAIEGEHTMELMDLQFAVNQRKSNVPFLETSVEKLTLYLTNQRGNVVIDFRQKGEAGGKMHWSLGPIAKRAIGMMAIDTVIDVIKTIEGGGESPGLPGDIPPEVIDIFRGIFR